jgi:thioredoxin 1
LSAAAAGRRSPPNQRNEMSAVAEVTDSQWESIVMKSKTPVLVDFWAEWCAPCRAMSPLIDKLSQEFAGRLKVVKINTQDNPEVPSRYGITAIPTLIVVKGGEVVLQHVGSLPYGALKAKLEPIV